MLPNVPYFPIAYYGVLRAGGVVVPMNPLLKGREVKFYLEDPGRQGADRLARLRGARDQGRGGGRSGAASWSSPGEFEKLLGEAEADHGMAERDGDDTAVILYTSGTTGKPKGAELTHSNLYKNCTVAADHLGEISKDDKLLGALPLFHSFGQTCTLNGAIHAQAMVSMIPRFDPEKALEIIERDKITLFQGVPTMYNGMLHACEQGRRGHLHAARVHVRWLGHAGGGDARRSRSSSAARCWRATACRRPRRWPRSTIPTRRTSRARSAPRSRASR